MKIQVTCWCARTEVMVEERRVAMGDTDSCGRRVCDPTMNEDRYNWRALFRKQPTRAAVK